MTQTGTATGTQAHPHGEVPFNLYKQAAPLAAQIIENTKLTAPESPNDVRHIVISFAGSGYRYLEGQSAGILAPGEDANGKPHKLRLYSIASQAQGDHQDGKTLSLCVKRVVYTDPDTGEEKRGVCSNYLCNLKPGDSVNLTGPTGKEFLLPPVQNANIVMIATGTGIAPFRGFIKTRYQQRVAETGQTWLFFGAPYKSDYLYAEELAQYTPHESFHLATAFSREEQTTDGRKMYVQDRLYEQRDTLFALMQQPNTYVYMCGLRGMEKGIYEALEAAASSKGLSWQALLDDMKAQKRWLVEVY